MTAERQEGNAMRLGFATIWLAALLLTVAPWPPLRAATTERVVVDRYTGLAIDGFDPVAYFTDREARMGAADYEASASGAIWRFCNAANMAAFVANPEIYGPQFGGYDPVGIARGVPVQGNPLVWLVSGQRLFLFDREESRAAFSADPERYLKQARQQWPAVQATLAE
ncbi:hypothetical protein IP86_18800 [Rhodopseudomonas sp. AAP120]|uniref:YHS domain-containing (seleno)protein n=1 Tax=Rhodopseudomonas sp. AAP120 TaxID=1523430 RepID=UPI0006B88335|nr:YHS domain-containing (seleno)protein [Rhodopseudomonas sp. AAP120]KPF95526.1 hypothetical protein IP86_18800 [Rhodopseudomonas sp. AAP120]